MTKQIGVTGESNPVELPTGDGCLVITNASGLVSALKVSIGDDDFVPDKDGTAPTANGAYPIYINAPGYARLDVSSGSCDVHIVPQLKEKYR